MTDDVSIHYNMDGQGNSGKIGLRSSTLMSVIENVFQFYLKYTLTRFAYVKSIYDKYLFNVD